LGSYGYDVFEMDWSDEMKMQLTVRTFTGGVSIVAQSE
jgi:hypothetical protein